MIMNKKNNFKMSGYIKHCSYVSFMAIFLVFISLSSCGKRPPTSAKPPTSAELIERATLLIEQDSLWKAIEELEKIPVEDDLFQQAKLLMIKADSLNTVKRERMAEKERIRRERELEEQRIREEIERQKQEIERQEQERIIAEKRRGFRVLTETNSVTVGDVTLRFNSVNTNREWRFDRHGDRWFYRRAQRGQIFLISQVAISSESHNPRLPPIAVYKMLNGRLSLIGIKEYRFVRWRDYGAFLGNHLDFGNSFAHTQTISFTCGLSVSSEDMANVPIFVVVKRENCFNRYVDRFGRPSVSYRRRGCTVSSTLTVDDFDYYYVLIRVFNRNNL